MLKIYSFLLTLVLLTGCNEEIKKPGSSKTPDPVSEPSNPKPSDPTSPSTPTEPAKPFDPHSITYSPPIVILNGGTYKGNWESKNSEIPAVEIRTKEPVVIINSVIRGAGYLIKSWYYDVNVTIKDSRAYGITPTPYKDYKKPRRFLAIDGFKNVVVENNYLEHTAGIYLGLEYKGNGTPNETIKIRYNKVKNIDGRIYNGKELVNFVQFNYRSQSVPHVEIAWNEVINEPGNSAVEDNINIYNSRGTFESPIRIHNNYIQGAYPAPGETRGYSGGGIITDCPEVTAEKATAFLEAYDNQIINSLNYGMGIAGGNNIKYYRNRVVSSSYLPDGRKVHDVYQNVWPNGFWAKDYYKKGSTFANVFDNNTVGVLGWDHRKDVFTEELEGTKHSNWNHLPDPITLDVQKNEYEIWKNKLSAKEIFIGPRN